MRIDINDYNRIDELISEIRRNNIKLWYLQSDLQTFTEYSEYGSWIKKEDASLVAYSYPAAVNKIDMISDYVNTNKKLIEELHCRIREIEKGETENE